MNVFDQGMSFTPWRLSARLLEPGLPPDCYLVSYDFAAYLIVQWPDPDQLPNTLSSGSTGGLTFPYGLDVEPDHP